MEPDFSGWASKAGLKCSDGRTIMEDAFKHQDTMTVPLVWSHQHKDPENVLGHVLLTNKPEGLWCDAFFNKAPKAQATKEAVIHGDVKFLSIWANKLKERSSQVFHGMVREVSLVLAGANPGATIENIALQHGDGELEHFDDEAIITTGIELFLAHAEDDSDKGDDAGEEDGESAKDIYESLSDKQMKVVHNMIAIALEAGAEADDSAEHSEDGENETGTDAGDDNNEDESLNHQKGIDVNVFEKDGKKSANTGDSGSDERIYLSHDELDEIKETWKRGGSMKHAVEEYALKHGIENLDLLFPDPKLVGDVEFDKRRTEWVDGVISGTRKSPYSRIKTLLADITQEAARARGYIKGNLKKEEWFGLTKRTTSPTTVYKKQKLDRDDVLDATDLNVVAFMKKEMDIMLREEIARAILISDGRPVEDPANPGEPNPDKVQDPMGEKDGVGIRSILHDDELYAPTRYVTAPAPNTTWLPVAEQVMIAMDDYEGSGTPTLYTTRQSVTKMLLSKDGFGRRMWNNKSELAAALGVDRIVDVPVMRDEADLFGIIVDLHDYNVGTDKGGEVTLFDDFDLNYNQLLWLAETRFSGALVKIRSAIIIKFVAEDIDFVTPNELEFTEATNTIEYVAQAGVVYSLVEGGVALAADVVIAADQIVYARPAAGYSFPSNIDDEWLYEFQA